MDVEQKAPLLSGAFGEEAESSQDTLISTCQRVYSRLAISGQTAQQIRKCGALPLFLLPSFVLQVLNGKSTHQTQVPVPPTIYLDGLRGIFSFFVFVRHFLLPWDEGLDNGYAQRDIEPNIGMNLFKLPFVRLLYSAPTVPVFFIVSGFVLAYKPLKLIRKRDYKTLGKGLMSSVFRRLLRLFIPPIFTTILVAIGVSLGLWNSPYDSMPGMAPRHPKQFEDIFQQLQDWLRFVLNDLTNPWNWKTPKSEYDSHLWTIPIQFRSSMVVFLTLMGLARLKPVVRGGIILGLWLYSLQQGRWEMALFFAGVFLAERNLELHDDSAKQGSLNVAENVPRSPAIWRRVLWIFVFIVGLYICSFPRARLAGPATPRFVWMSILTDHETYWRGYGATLLVWAVNNESLLQGLFTSSLFRYLGSISFSLYLIHGPVLHLFGYSLVLRFQGAMGSKIGLALALVVLTPIVIWIADIFWRAVDKPCAKLVTQVEAFCFEDRYSNNY